MNCTELCAWRRVAYTHSHTVVMLMPLLSMELTFHWGIMSDNEWKEQRRKHMKWRSDKSKCMWGDVIHFPIHGCRKIINPLFYLHWNRRTKWYETWQWQIYMMVESIRLSLPTFCIQECSAVGWILSSVSPELWFHAYIQLGIQNAWHVTDEFIFCYFSVCYEYTHAFPYMRISAF
jgi:hypothetical protein